MLSKISLHCIEFIKFRKIFIFADQGKIPLAMITTMKKLKSGYINGTRVSLGNLNDFLSTSCITNLSFLGSSEDGRPDKLNPQVNTISFVMNTTKSVNRWEIIKTFSWLLRFNNIWMNI